MATDPNLGVVIGDDGKARCAWAHGAEDYAAYHHTEWGVAVHEEHALYERMMLEAFQSGLSWLTILRKREGIRDAFAQFDPEIVAAFTERDIDRLLQDARIIRNRQKINAAITNARAVLNLRDHGGLDALIWSFAPGPREAPRYLTEVPAKTETSVALAKALKKAGFVFVGPTTAYAMMQAIGMVNDHMLNCHVRDGNVPR